jgi:hypothetical protein
MPLSSTLKVCKLSMEYDAPPIAVAVNRATHSYSKYVIARRPFVRATG